mmetsp:Transcript_13272/g.18082  ORF Transcript_13272/g.18082 Transcript_13272/m.18082 type:complete len:223 (+) Transcript_13272:1805-2473(+)
MVAPARDRVTMLSTAALRVTQELTGRLTKPRWAEARPVVSKRDRAVVSPAPALAVLTSTTTTQASAAEVITVARAMPLATVTVVATTETTMGVVVAETALSTTTVDTMVVPAAKAATNATAEVTWTAVEVTVAARVIAHPAAVTELLQGSAALMTTTSHRTLEAMIKEVVTAVVVVATMVAKVSTTVAVVVEAATGTERTIELQASFDSTHKATDYQRVLMN